MNRPAFFVTVLNKERMIYKSVMGALSQTYPCDIYISDAGSTDDTPSEIERALANADIYPQHTITRLHPQLSEVKCGLRILNEHLMWCFEQIQNEWIFHSSGDDWSLPHRVEACMKALETNKAAAVATPQFHLPENGKLEGPVPSTVAPHLKGYLSAQDGINKLGFGGCIAGYRRDFILKVGTPGLATPDVFWGYLAALDDGYFVVPEPHHVHTDSPNPDNNGFGGRLMYAAQIGDETELAQLNELNRFQMFGHYYECAIKQEAYYPRAPAEAKAAIMNAMFSQAIGWYRERVEMHRRKMEPISMNKCDNKGMRDGAERRRVLAAMKREKKTA